MASRRKLVDQKRRSSRATNHNANGRQPIWGKADIPRICREVERIVSELGASDEDIADFYGMTERTLYRYKVRYPEFARAMLRGEDQLVKLVERHLIRSATGFRQRALKILQHDGVPILVDYEKAVEPNVQAQVAYLKAKRPAEYGTKVEIGADPKSPFRFIIDGLDMTPGAEKEGANA